MTSTEGPPKVDKFGKSDKSGKNDKFGISEKWDNISPRLLTKLCE